MKIKIREIASYSKGSQINGDELIEDGAYEYLNGGIKPSGRWNDYNCNGNTVTISEGGNSSGFVNYMKSPFWCGAHCYYLHSTIDNTKYLYYALKSQQSRLMGIRSGACMPNIKKADLGNFEFEFNANPKEQEQIVLVLDKAHEMVNKRQQELVKLDELVKARFVEMFGDPVINQFDWEQTKLKNISIGKLSYGSGSSAIDYDNDVRYVRITDITDIGELNDDLKSPSVFEEKYLLKDGDILFARSGATVGKTFKYDAEKYGKCIFAGYLIRLIPNKEMVIPDYIFWFTKTSYYQSFIEKAQRAVAQPNINAQEYGDLTICVPPIELQNQFAEFVKQVDKSKFIHQKNI